MSNPDDPRFSCDCHLHEYDNEEDYPSERLIDSKDPTFTELVGFLYAHGFDGAHACIAIHAFASAWHGGQNSNLYRAITESGFVPGPIFDIHNEPEAYEALQALEQHYCEPYDI